MCILILIYNNNRMTDSKNKISINTLSDRPKADPSIYNEEWMKPYIKDFENSKFKHFDFYLFTHMKNEEDLIKFHKWYNDTFIEQTIFEKNLNFFSKGDYGDRIAKLY